MEKKSKRTSFRVLTLIFMLIVGMAGEDYISVDPVLRRVMQLVSECAPSWKLVTFYRDVDENGVKYLSIQYMDEPEDHLYVEDIYKIYSSLTQYLLEGEEAPYKGWNMELRFVSTNRARTVCISDINENKNDMYLNINTRIPVKDLARFFPEASRLKVYRAYYESIDEIAGFYNLKWIHIEPGITKEEKTAIYSIFPDCEVHCKPLKEETPSLENEKK